MDQGSVAESLEEKCLQTAQEDLWQVFGLDSQLALVDLDRVSLRAMEAVLRLPTLAVGDENDVWDLVLSWGRYTS